MTRDYIPAVRCKDLYKNWTDPDSEEYNENVASEFTNQWICPNVTQLKLYGDPKFMPFNEGQSLVMIVNSCPIAKIADFKMRLDGYDQVTYTNVDCSDQEAIDDGIQAVTVQSKIMT